MGLSRRGFLKTLSAGLLAAAAQEVLRPLAAVAEEIARPASDPELARVLGEESAPSRREKPPRFFFFGDGDHRNLDGRYALAEKASLAALAEKGVKALFVEIPEQFQPLVDALAEGKITDNAFAEECFKQGARPTFDPSGDPERSTFGFQVKLIRNCAAMGIRVYAVDCAAQDEDVPSYASFFRDMYYAREEAKPRTIADTQKFDEDYIKAHQKEYTRALTDLKKHRLKMDATVAKKIKSILSGYAETDSAAILYGITHADHSLMHEIKDSTPSLIDKLGGESAVAKICLPNPADSLGPIKGWRMLDLRGGKFVGDAAPTAPSRPTQNHLFDFLRPQNER